MPAVMWGGAFTRCLNTVRESPVGPRRWWQPSVPAALGARTPAFSPARLRGRQAAQTVPSGLIEVLLIGELIILLFKHGSVHPGCKALRLLGNRPVLPRSRRSSDLLQRKLWCGQ